METRETTVDTPLAGMIGNVQLTATYSAVSGAIHSKARHPWRSGTISVWSVAAVIIVTPNSEVAKSIVPSVIRVTMRVITTALPLSP